MTVAELIEGLPITASETAVEIAGVTQDSRRVSPRDLFVALSGARFDGRDYAAEAVRRGAAAVLSAPPPLRALGVPWLETSAPRRVLGPLAARIYGHPERRLLTAGVTGTNGKSTVAALLAAILDAAGRPAALLGTLGYGFGARREPAARTTPEASDLFRLLAEFAADGAAAAVMEVSSHALALERTGGMSFDVAVFTNLSRDHLDFHADLDAYFAAKRRLFDQLAVDGRAVVNLDDPYGRRLAAELPEAVTFATSGDRAAAVRLTSLTVSSAGIEAAVATRRGALEIASPLLGRLNAENVLAAVAAAEALALAPAAIRAGVAALGPLPGRLEPVARGQAFTVLVDFAHTDAALAAVLRSAREIGSGRLIAVFGCGGDRDAGKRPLMGRVAGELADLPIATSDNPRGEDPEAILAAVAAGLEASGNRSYETIPDRRRAIFRAVAEAAPGDVVLVAGKGHEEVQLVGATALPFSDRTVLEEALEELLGAGNAR